MVTVDRYDTLDGQVALVTGATRGIGERVAAVPVPDLPVGVGTRPPAPDGTA